MGRNGRTLAIPPHSGVGWSCARSGRPRPEARPTPQALRVACAPGGASAREGRPGARPAARPPPLLARPRLGPGPFSLLPERRALSHLRLPARPPRSARLAAGPDPPFRSRHTNVAPQGGNAASCHVSHTAHAVAHLSLPEIILLVSLCPRGGGGAGRYRSLASNAAPPVPRTRQGAWRCPVTVCRMHERIVGRLETFGR